MDWNALRSKWQKREDAAGSGRLERPGGAARLWHRVRSRDLLETAVAIPLVPFFAVCAYWMAREGMWITAFFALFLVAVIVYIPRRLWRARRLIPRPDPNRPVREFLAAERAALAAQAEMLGSVARWYYGPIAVGVLGFYVSIKGFALSSLLYTLFVIALCVAIEAANRCAVRTRFLPAIEMIDEQIDQLEKEDD